MPSAPTTLRRSTLMAAGVLALVACTGVATSPSPTASNRSPAPSVNVGSLAWTRVTAGPGFPNAFFQRVFAGPSGTTAVLGRIEHAVSLTSAIRSDDGLSWEAVDAFPIAKTSGIPATAVGQGVLETSGAYIGWGDYYPGGAVVDSHAAFWSSHDGHSFELVGKPETLDVGAVADVTVGSGIAVATGRDALIYTSTDFKAWTRVQPSSMVGRGARALFDGHTFVVLTSGRGAFALTSSDGRSWSKPAVTIADGAVVVSGAASAAGFLALTGISGDGTALWLSKDGTSWTPVPDAGLRSTTVLDVAAGPSGRGFLAVGGGADQKPTLWYSEDGLTWMAVPESSFDLPFGFASVVAIPGAIVIGGFDDAAHSAVAWVGKPR
jgi:hypothetical protein